MSHEDLSNVRQGLTPPIAPVSGEFPISVEKLRQQSRLSIQPGVIIPIEPGGCIHFKNLRGVIVDLDETVAGNTGNMHDSWCGKFSYALRTVLSQEGRNFSDEEWKDLWNGTDGKPGFGRHHGQAAQTIRLKLAQEARDLLDVEVSDEALKKAISGFYRDLPTSELINDLRVVQRADAMVKGFSKKGISSCLCTASEFLFLEALRAVAKFETTLSRFDHFVADAQKKTADGFSKAGAEEACLQIGRHPRDCIMCGDSMSDIGGAAMAGVPFAVIRPAGDYDWLDPMRFKALSDEFHYYRNLHPELGQITVMVVSSWDQLRFDHAPDQDDQSPLCGVIEERILSTSDIQTGDEFNYGDDYGADLDATFPA